jgi:CheY-like chemotaxis protein
VISAENGKDALRLAESTPDLFLALIDQSMPEMPGIEVVRRLRSLMPTIILVMATVLDDAATIDGAFAAGVNMFLIKPNGFIELYNRLKSTPDIHKLLEERVIIDAYGPRRYRGASLHKGRTSITNAYVPSSANGGK